MKTKLSINKLKFQSFKSMISTKSKKRLATILIITLGAIICLYLLICNNSSAPILVEKKAIALYPKLPKTEYYCIDRHSSYYTKKKEFKNDIASLENYFIKNHDAKYDLIWHKKKDGWYLDTSGWEFSMTDKGNKSKPKRWLNSPCKVNKAKTQASCPLIQHSGILWKLQLVQFQGGFIKLKLYRVPISEEAIQRAQMSQFLGGSGVKPDIDICLRIGQSPLL